MELVVLAGAVLTIPGLAVVEIGSRSTSALVSAVEGGRAALCGRFMLQFAAPLQ